MNTEYLINPDCSKEYVILYRKIGHQYDIWTSKSKQWTPSAYACDAFLKPDVFADSIEEQEVNRIIEQFF